MAVRRTQLAQTPESFVGEQFAVTLTMSRAQQTFQPIGADDILGRFVVNQAPFMALRGASFPFGATVNQIGGGGGGGPTTYYRLRGWNPLTNQFEHWTGTSPTTPPPSLASLLEISYVEFEA